MSDEFIQFDKNKLFYDMVGTFVLALSASPAMFRPRNPMGFTTSDLIQINGVQVADKHWPALEAYEQAQAGHARQEDFIGHLCMMLANLSFETVKEKHDGSPQFEFFRHVRNAASHNNRFFFNRDEPKHPASWRGQSLDHIMPGINNPMFNKPCFGALLGPADLLELLHDIERRIAP